jgi:hypothetical protein
MLELTSAGQPVHLNPGTSVQLEYNSPLFDEDTIQGSFSYSLSIPAGPNGRLYGWPERPDRAGEPGAVLPAELADDGLPLLTGAQRVKSASAQKYSISLQAGLSGAQLSERQLSSFAYGGLRAVPRYVPLVGLPGTSGHGLSAHANAVVANPAAYDYVFAPLRNEYRSPAQALPPGATLAPTAYPLNTVNQWVVNPAPLLGMPAGGTFVYNIDFVVVPVNGAPAFEPLPPYCPFPRLRYVLQAICEESGLPVDVANLLPGELGELVVAGNAQLVDRGDATTFRFSLADVVPAMTVAELLAALRQDYGIVVYQDVRTRRVRSGYLHERVAPGAPHQDYSAHVAGGPEVTIGDTQGLTLTYQVDGDDELTKDLLEQQPAAHLVLPAVATVADLPAQATILTDNPKTGQVRLVQQLDTYYACTVQALNLLVVNLTWAPLVVNLPPVLVGGGGDEQAQATCYTAERPTELYQASGVTIALPAISQPPYRADQTEVERSRALRLLFYRGLQLASDGVMRCPQLSHQSLSGALSTRLTGTSGTYPQLLKDWLPVKLRGSSYKVPLLLTSLDLARLDLTRQVWLDGVAYLVRKLSATVPLKKAASAELVRL